MTASMFVKKSTADDYVFAPKLQAGDNVRVVAASRSLSIISEENQSIARRRFEELGLTVSYAKFASKIDDRNSLPAEQRVADLEAAFADPAVKALFTVIGGYNSINMLDKINFDIIASNPKIICGYSDVTVLLNAIHARTGLVTYYGPHFSTLGMLKGLEYTLEHIRSVLMQDEPVKITPSPEWSDDTWFLNQEQREFLPNPGPVVLQEGETEGILVGGNINAFRLLNGTAFAPTLKDKLLFLENDGLDKETTYQEFDRRLDSILLQPHGHTVKGLIIGRFKRISQMDLAKLNTIISSKAALRGKPVVYGYDFGHTNPMITVPIGGWASLSALANQPPSWVLRNH